MTPRPIAAVKRTLDRVRDAYNGRVKDLRDLRASAAIEPLPHRDPMPLELRSLDWGGGEEEPVPAAAVVRRLRRAERDPEDDNKLGCAYAVLAWERSHDEYWLLALDHLANAAKAASDVTLRKRAKDNLSFVAHAGRFPAPR